MILGFSLSAISLLPSPFSGHCCLSPGKTAASIKLPSFWVAMGNCWRKHAHQHPNNQPVDVLRQPAGTAVYEAGVQISRPNRSSSSLYTPKDISTAGVENRCKNEACGYPLRERNALAASESNPQKERHGKDGKQNSPATPKDWSVLNVNKKEEVFPAYRLNCFCYRLLRAATGKFGDKNFIGEGGFGDVYKGYVDFRTMNVAKPGNGGRAIAVKRLRKDIPQGHDEWLNEMRFLSRLKHPNIVRLLGYCSEGEHRILVYEYMTKGSLEAHLLRENNKELNWKRRIKIAVGAAKGLEYLHTRGKPVVHRDVKAANVLLDSDYNAKISDFGLAKFGPQGDQTHITTRILGTRGYFAPEYVAKGHLTLKTDVYSFGVVLLEILSGCGAIRKHLDGVAGELAQWARPHLSNKLELHRVIDKKLGRSIPIEEAHQFAKIIVRCLSSNPTDRPEMTEVVADLQQLQENMSGYNLASLQYLRTRR